MIAAEALGKGLSAPSLVEHAADADAVQMCGFDAESDDPTRKDIHDDHHPEDINRRSRVNGKSSRAARASLWSGPTESRAGSPAANEP